jgi:hypothetical protein
MSTALAFGIFLLLAGAWWQGLVSAACAVPFFWLMRLVEGAPEEPDEPAP